MPALPGTAAPELRTPVHNQRYLMTAV